MTMPAFQLAPNTCAEYWPHCPGQRRELEMNASIETRFGSADGGVLRWSLVAIFLGFGSYKFTPQEEASRPV